MRRVSQLSDGAPSVAHATPYRARRDYSPVVAIIACIYRYPDGREERDPPFETHESYGVGETRVHEGIRWKAVEGHMIDGDPNRFELIFVPE